MIEFIVILAIQVAVFAIGYQFKALSMGTLKREARASRQVVELLRQRLRTTERERAELRRELKEIQPWRFER